MTGESSFVIYFPPFRFPSASREYCQLFLAIFAVSSPFLLSLLVASHVRGVLVNLGQYLFVVNVGGLTSVLAGADGVLFPSSAYIPRHVGTALMGVSLKGHLSVRVVLTFFRLFLVHTCPFRFPLLVLFPILCLRLAPDRLSRLKKTDVVYPLCARVLMGGAVA